MDSASRPGAFVSVALGDSALSRKENPWIIGEETDRLFVGETDKPDRRLVPVGDERFVREGESLGEVVERLGDVLGWESLSAFARKRLERDE